MNIEGIRGIGSSYAPALTQNSAVPAGVRTPEEASPRSVVIPYLSPALRYDSDAGVAILLFRDGNSGEVELQYPSRQVVREYQLRGRESAQSSVGQSADDGKQGRQGNSLLTLARAGVASLTSTAPTVAPGESASTGSSAGVAAGSAVPAAGTTGGSVNFVA